jgi:hypothetical protein
MSAGDGPMDAPRLLVAWEQVVGQLLDRTAQFPKAVRFTFASRLDTRALDALECLVRARFSTRDDRLAALEEADAHFAVLRVLLRISYERRYLAPAAFEALVRAMDEAGRMLGGWRRHLHEVQ